MKVDEIRQQLDTLRNQQVDIEGFLLVIEFGTGFDILISTTEAVPDESDIAIPLDYSLAELRKLAPPMVTMQLIHRGDMLHPPYYYRFPLELTARVHVDPHKNKEANPKQMPHVSLRDITKMTFYAPFAGKQSEILEATRYLYHIDVTYGEYKEPQSDFPARAKIAAEKILPMTHPDDMQAVKLSSDDNRYARTVIGQRVTIPGWIRYIPDTQGHQHYVLQTFALRPSMVGVGPLRSLTNIWWKPNARYQVLRSHISGDTRQSQHERRVSITGQIAYLSESDAPQFPDIEPSLYFTQVHEVTVHEERYLLAQHRDDTLGDEDHAERAKRHAIEPDDEENEA